MNILTFDIEDWYNCDFISNDFNWNEMEVRIYSGVDKILESLEEHNLKATFFCLGWIGENHPSVVKKIASLGHQVGCHSFKHNLLYNFNRTDFINDTLRAKSVLEDLIGKEVNSYRAPGFSIKKQNVWALEELVNLGFKYDSSIFPSNHDYGGFPELGITHPVKLKFKSGKYLREFPMSVKKICGNSIVFSGGGYFRLLPYSIIKKFNLKSNYTMTYFHPRDFDPDQPLLKHLPLSRLFKSYVGLKKAYGKYTKFLTDFNFLSIEEASKKINWEKNEFLIDNKINTEI